MTRSIEVGRVGIWGRQLRFGDRPAALEAAAELEELGMGTLWIPGGIGGDLLKSVEEVLAVTNRCAVATGILNIWSHPADEVAATHARLDEAYGGRFLLGLGVSHAPLIDADDPGRYSRPLTRMREYLGVLEAGDPPGRRLPRCIAALAPRMLALARERTLGTHPYMVPAAHARRVRETLGPELLLAPELSVILESDDTASLAIARRDLSLYLGFPNYWKVWLSLGFDESDLENGGSVRLVDALYARGTAETIRTRVDEFYAAGADHVCLRVITGHLDDAERLPLAEWRELAAAIVG